MKGSCERRKRIYRVDLIGEGSKALAECVSKEPGSGRMSENPVFALVVQEQVVSLHGDIRQARKLAGTGEARRPHPLQKPSKRPCTGLSTIRITLERLPKIEGVKQHSKPFRFAYGGKPSEQP